jgi:CHASE2 domain-containing sensor protein
MKPLGLLGAQFAASSFKLLDRIFPKPVTFGQHLRQNLLVGLLVVGLVIAFQNTEAVRASREQSIDWLIGMNRGIDVAPGNDARPFVFYDIDDKSQQLWGEPLITPRDKLATLIAAALEKRPAVLIVDVELRKSTTDDAALLAVLRRHAATPAAPVLVLVESFRWNDGESGETGGGNWVTRPSFIDSALPANDRRRSASPLFAPDQDGQFRRWRSWLSACSPQGQPVIVPSVQTLVLASLSGEPALAALDRALGSASPRSCGEAARLAQTPMVIGTKSIALAGDAFTQRILFALPWKLAADETRPQIDFAGGKAPLLSILPAHAVTEGGLRTTLAPGHIAVIGASNQDARDVHVTPLGEMPGSLILINAIDSLIRHGQLATPAAWVQLLAASVLLTLVSLIASKFPTLLGTLISLAVLIAILVPLSVYFFRYGVWLDFALPVVAVKFFELTMSQIRKHLHNRKTAHYG